MQDSCPIDLVCAALNGDIQPEDLRQLYHWIHSSEKHRKEWLRYKASWQMHHHLISNKNQIEQQRQAFMAHIAATKEPKK